MCENLEASQQEEDRGSESKFAFDWKIVLVGSVSGLVVGVILGNEFCTDITEWVAIDEIEENVGTGLVDALVFLPTT
ncbi:hypothetical protein Ddye_016171 [Dipteronia dyeriana]|uniref:Uncharacterized protein n=1 Tax=Dipteronia dyeriana TaxID=168575 RepID=A0AAD9U6D7_9ROSI|nr:hypothetical protein Ddye_016171 [Dipteronia dyeriana]